MASQRSSQVDRPSGDLSLVGRLTGTLVPLAATFAFIAIERVSAPTASYLKKLDSPEGSTQARTLEECPHFPSDPGEHLRRGSFDAALHGDALHAHFLKRCEGGSKVCMSRTRL